MTLAEVQQKLQHIQDVALELDDPERASSMERDLLMRTIEACIMHNIDIPTLKEVVKVATIQFRRW